MTPHLRCGVMRTQERAGSTAAARRRRSCSSQTRPNRAKAGSQISSLGQRAVTLETGIHNSALGMALIFTFFPQASGMLLIAAFWGCWHLVSGLSLAWLWSRSAPDALPAGEATP